VHKIPATILSRCMRFDFRLISTDKIASLISKIYDEQGKAYEKEAVYAIAKAGEGSIRDALSIADIALSFGTGKLTYDEVTEILGTSNSEVILEFVSNVLSSNSGLVLSLIDKLASLGKGMGVLIKDITALIRDLLVVKMCENANSILGLPQNRFDEYKNLASSTSEDRIIRVLEVFSDAENMLKYTNHPRVIFETASIKATKPESDYNIDALIARISELENKLNILQQNGIKVQTQQPEVKPKNVVEEVKEEKKEEIKIENTKISIQQVGVEELKGKMLLNLRKVGAEILWTLLQTSKIEIKGNILVITAKNSGDLEFFDKAMNRAKIEESLSEYLPFELQIILSESEKNLDAIDQATERVKNIFGDDIVIIK
jgi:DNA polymerase III gamma/tau subunit